MPVIQPTVLRSSPDRRAYVWAALAAALIAVLGFARTYYLKALFAQPPLPGLLHVHGALMSLWCILFVVQTALIAAHRVELHRRLGVLGVALAALVVGMGTYLTVQAAAAEVHRHLVGRFHFLLGLNLVNLLLFAVLLTAGILFRSRPAYHKRLMLLAAVTLLAPAIARITLVFTHSAMVQLATFDCCILLCVMADTLRHRRLHPAFGWGALLILASFHLTFLAVQTRTWLTLVPRWFS